MLCKNCGTELNENAKFCNSCGAAVGTENVPEVSPVPAKNGSENWKGQEPFSGEPAAADETAQPGEAAPAEAVDAVEAAPAEAAPAAKKHNVLLYVIIALAVIIIAILIFKKPSDSKDPSNSSGEYIPTSHNSGTSLSAEESMVVGTWYPYAGYSDGDTTYFSRYSGTLYLFNDHTGALYVGGELSDSFTWYYNKYTDGYYVYSIYRGNSSTIGLYDFDNFIIGDGESMLLFEK